MEREMREAEAAAEAERLEAERAEAAQAEAERVAREAAAQRAKEAEVARTLAEGQAAKKTAARKPRAKPKTPAVAESDGVAAPSEAKDIKWGNPRPFGQGCDQCVKTSKVCKPRLKGPG